MEYRYDFMYARMFGPTMAERIISRACDPQTATSSGPVLLRRCESRTLASREERRACDQERARQTTMEPNNNRPAEDQQEDEQGEPLVDIRQELQLPRADNVQPPVVQYEEEEMLFGRLIRDARERFESKLFELDATI